MKNNDAYSEEQGKHDDLFLNDNQKESKHITFADGYKIIKTFYAGKVNNLNLHGNCILSNAKEKIIHEWKNF